MLSSDLVPTTAALREILTRITEGEADIIVGTQLVSKGHNFPLLSFVGVVDGDLSLATADPRAGERTFQLLHQVTGRAGRFGAPGFGLIQTHYPDHPVMRALVTGDRQGFYEAEIALREEAGLPPFGRLAAIVIQAKERQAAEGYARELALAAPEARLIQVLGPVEAPLAVIRGWHRQRLLVKAGARRICRGICGRGSTAPSSRAAASSCMWMSIRIAFCERFGTAVKILRLASTLVSRSEVSENRLRLRSW